MSYIHPLMLLPLQYLHFQLYRFRISDQTTIKMIFNPCPPSWSMFPMTLETQEMHDILLMIKTTAKNLRVTLSRNHLTRSRNQISATKSLEYMFHCTPVEYQYSFPSSKKTVTFTIIASNCVRAQLKSSGGWGQN